jgi:putative toxin-antitoxin system antitoxin component (TIGR02293 family)
MFVPKQSKIVGRVATRRRRRSPAESQSSFVALVHMQQRELAQVIELIRLGLPAAFLKEAGDYFKLPTAKIRVVARVAETTAFTLARKAANLDAAASERVWRMADVANMACEVFEDEELAKRWLVMPSRIFNDAAPIDYLDTEPGAAAVRQVLNAIATGGAL